MLINCIFWLVEWYSLVFCSFKVFVLFGMFYRNCNLKMIWKRVNSLMSYQNIMSSKLFLIRIVNAIFKNVNYCLNSRKTFISNVLPFIEIKWEKSRQSSFKNKHCHSWKGYNTQHITTIFYERILLILIIRHLSFNTKKSKKRWINLNLNFWKIF